jgi:hypothetical protein
MLMQIPGDAAAMIFNSPWTARQSAIRGSEAAAD